MPLSITNLDRLFTEANAGLGYETARVLSFSKYPYHIFVGSRSLKRGVEAVARLRQHSNGATTFSVLKLDVTSDADISAAFEEVASKHNHLDVLVNNAGIATDNIDQPGSPSLRATFQGTFDTNVVHREQDGKTVEGSIDGCNNTHLRLTNQQC